MAWERRLPPLAEDALDILSAAADGEADPNDEDAGEESASNADFTEETAIATLVESEAFAESDAAEALDLLDRRGYIYFVDGGIYITPTDD